MCGDTPCKIFIEDLSKFRKTAESEYWVLKLSAGIHKSRNLKMNTVWIQGKIDTVIDNTDKISVIIKDRTGTVKVTHVGEIELAKPWISTDVYCSAVGYIKEVAGVPEVYATKMIDLSHNPSYEMIWPYEVKELKLILLGLIKPHLQSVEDTEW